MLAVRVGQAGRHFNANTRLGPRQGDHSIFLSLVTVTVYVLVLPGCPSPSVATTVTS